MLPSKFQFKHRSSKSTIYTAEIGWKGDYRITWKGSSPNGVPWPVGEVEKLVEQKYWIPIATNNKEAIHFLKKD